MRYIYFCPNCGSKKEVEHSMKEKPKITCDLCCSKMKIQISGGIGTIFKGGGWTKKNRSSSYYIDREKDLIRGGVKEDPYKKWRDTPL